MMVVVGGEVRFRQLSKKTFLLDYLKVVGMETWGWVSEVVDMVMAAATRVAMDSPWQEVLGTWGEE